MSKNFRYTHAIVCRIPYSWSKNAIGGPGDADLDLARRQHSEYVARLRSVGLDVIELPSDETLPDCPYVEDTAVICNGIALLAKPGASSRKKEVTSKQVSFANLKF